MGPLFAEVLKAAKLAAETYGRRPSTANAEKLDASWQAILELDSINQLQRTATEEGTPRDVGSGVPAWLAHPWLVAPR